MSLRYKGILFIDLDGTFVRWSLFLYLIDEAIKAGLFPAEMKDAWAEKERKWRERAEDGNYDDYLWAVIIAYEAHLTGVSVDDLHEIGEKVAKRYKNYVYQYTRKLIEEKLAEGWYVVAVTCSPEEVVKPFCELWGIHEYCASTIRRNGDVYTNEREIPEEKGPYVQAILDRPEFAHIEKDNIWAIGDTGGDVGMLALAGKAICFNPNRKLYDYCAKVRRIVSPSPWTIVVERKDVIYKL